MSVTIHVLSNNFFYTRKLVLVPLSLVSVFHECLKAGIRTQIFWGLYLSVNVFSTKVQIGDNRVPKCDVIKNEICEIMGFVKLF